MVIKLASTTIKQKMDTTIKKLYFKLSINNITFSTFKEFSLEKIDSNIKVDVSLLDSSIQEVARVKILNITNCDNTTFRTTLFMANSKKNLYFQNS